MRTQHYIVYTKLEGLGTPPGKPKWVPTLIFTFRGENLVDAFPIKNKLLHEMAWAESVGKADMYPDDVILKKAKPKEAKKAFEWLSAFYRIRNGARPSRRHKQNVRRKEETLPKYEREFIDTYIVHLGPTHTTRAKVKRLVASEYRTRARRSVPAGALAYAWKKFRKRMQKAKRHPSYLLAGWTKKNPMWTVPMTWKQAKDTVNNYLWAMGRDYHRGVPVRDMLEFMSFHGILPFDPDEETPLMKGGFIVVGREGTVQWPVVFGDKVKNSLWVLQWYKMPSGRYEVTSYLS